MEISMRPIIGLACTLVALLTAQSASASTYIYRATTFDLSCSGTCDLDWWPREANLSGGFDTSEDTDTASGVFPVWGQMGGIAGGGQITLSHGYVVAWNVLSVLSARSGLGTVLTSVLGRDTYLFRFDHIDPNNEPYHHSITASGSGPSGQWYDVNGNLLNPAPLPGSLPLLLVPLAALALWRRKQPGGHSLCATAAT